MGVIGIEHDDDDSSVLGRRRPTIRRGLPLAAGLVLTAALMGFLAGRMGSTGGLPLNGPVDSLIGSMVLELQKTQPDLQGRALSGQAEYRGEDWKGTITVDASGEHTGAARLKGSGAYVPTDSGPVVSHMWGSAEVTLDGQSCTGTYGYSSYRDSSEGGGSMHLRCDGGSVLGATMTAAGTEPPSGTRDWTITVALTDGYFFESP